MTGIGDDHSEPGSAHRGKDYCGIAIADITEIAWEEPTRLVDGFLQFSTAASAAVAGRADKSKDPHTVLFLKKSRDELAALRDQLGVPII